MGCLILSFIGLLPALFFILAGFNPNSSPGTGLIGFALLAICGIYILRFFVKKAQAQKVGELPGQTGAAQPQTQQQAAQTREVEQEQWLPPQQSSSGGVLFVPRVPPDPYKRESEDDN